MQIIPVTPQSPEWHALRARNVGSSEISALFNLSPYMTHFELWHLKKGNIADNFGGSKRTRYGLKLEAVIAECVAEETGWRVEEAPGYYRHATIAGMACTPDRLVYADNKQGPGVLEIKNVDAIQYKKEWVDGEPPVHILLQHQHQLACTGYAWGAVVPLVGGNDIKPNTLDRHEPTIAKLESGAVDFWKTIEANTPPAPFAPDDYDVVRRLYDKPRDEEIDLSGNNELPVLCAELATISSSSGEAEKRRKTLQAKILDLVGNAERARCNGFLIRAPEIVKHMKAKEASIQKYRQLSVREIRI